MFNDSRILAIADAIEHKNAGIVFDMGTYRTPEFVIDDQGMCMNTCYRGCVAGHAIHMYHNNPNYVTYDHQFVARKLLDLDAYEASELFLAESLGYRGRLPQFQDEERLGGDTNMEHAFRYIHQRVADVPNALRWMVANKDINWRHAFEGIDAINRKIEETPEEVIITYDELETV